MSNTSTTQIETSKPIRNFLLRKPSLTTQIFIALVLGVILGVAFPDDPNQYDLTNFLKDLSTMFLRMIKMMIAPLLFSTLVVGIAGIGDHKRMGRLGMKTILYFEIATTIALVIGLLVANYFQPGLGMSLDLAAGKAGDLAQLKQSAEVVAHHGFMDTFVEMFPTSVVDAMAKGSILQVVVFAVFFALAVVGAGEKGKPILNLMESLSEIMFKFVGLVMVFAPMGVMGAIGASIGHNGLQVLLIYAKLVGSLYFALGLFVMIVLVVACNLIKVPFHKLVSAIKEPVTLAFSTANSESALPKAMTIMEKFGVPKDVVSFVLPTGYSFNLDGSTLYLSLATMFVAQMAGIELSLQQQIMILLTLMLTSKGVAAVPRASLVILLGTLTAFGLPVEGVAVILGIDHVLDMGRTAVNLLGNCVASAVVARWEGVFDYEKMAVFGTENGEAEELEEEELPRLNPVPV